MKVEAAVAANFPLPRTSQDTQIKTVITKEADGSYKVNQDHYLTIIYTSQGQVREITRSWSVSYLV